MRDDLNIVPLENIAALCTNLPINTDFSLFNRTFSLMEKLCTEHNGIGLHAAQVGLPYNIFIVGREAFSNSIFWKLLPHYLHFVNCSYEGIGPEEYALEGCLSLNKGRSTYNIKRHKTIRVRGLLLTKGVGVPIVGNEFCETFEGAAARVLAHEIDHKEGRSLMIDRIGKYIGETNG